MNRKIWLLTVILLSQGLQARYFAVKNDSQFVDETNKYEFVITCFLPDPHSGQDFDRKLNKDIKLLQDTVRSTSETGPYKKILKNEVGFVVVDTSKENMTPLLKKYNISTEDDQPQFLLFKNGKVITAMSGKLAKLVGFISKSDLLEFIDDYFGKSFDEILSKRAEEDAQDREMQIAKYQAYASYRYPYGGYAPYNIWGSPSGQMYAGYAQFYPYGYSYNGYAYL